MLYRIPEDDGSSVETLRVRSSCCNLTVDDSFQFHCYKPFLFMASYISCNNRYFRLPCTQSSTCPANSYGYLCSTVVRSGSAGVWTRYELSGPGIESRWRGGFQHPFKPALGPTQPPVRWVPALIPGSMTAGA